MIRFNSITPTIPHHRRTLIADDEPDFLTALRLLLTGEGYEPETVSSLAAACLGALQKLILVKTQLSCPSGDRLLLFTYGLTEAADESNEQFGEERLMELLSRYRDSSAENLKQIIFKAVGNSAVTPSKTTRPRWLWRLGEWTAQHR